LVLEAAIQQLQHPSHSEPYDRRRDRPRRRLGPFLVRGNRERLSIALGTRI
jgi:hypothetical protein